MSTQLENFHKHRTTLNGQDLEVYYEIRPGGVAIEDKVSLFDILDADTRKPVRTIDLRDQKTIKDEIWGLG